MAMPTHIVAVGAFVENEQKQLLLVKTHHDGWVFPGGQVENGENLVDALIREVKEESGIEVTVSHLIGVYSNTASYKWHDGVTDVPTKVMFDFVCQPIGGKLRTSEETSDVRWADRDQILDLVTSPPVRTRFQAYFEYDGRTRYMEYVTKPIFEMKLDRNV